MACEEPGEKSTLQSEQQVYGCTNEPADRSGFRQRLTEQRQTVESSKKITSISRWKTFLIWHIGEEWIILILLGIIPSFFSWAMDFGIDLGLHGTRKLYEMAHNNIFLQYLAWVSVPILLICFATLFTQLVGPQAAGSGIPEIKTIVKGVNVKDHLSLKTLVAKLVGLTCSLGSGMPLGKESPFVHIGSICAAQLSRFRAYIGGVKASESEHIELLIVGSAVGIACCFGSPIGGILYGIEVATSFIMVRCYWKSYVAATISAFIFRFLPMWSGYNETIIPLFNTDYRLEFPYELQEILAFTILGILSGLFGAFFVFMNGVMVRFIRSPRRVSRFLAKTRVLYPAIVTLVISTFTFPPGFGQFMAGELTQRETLLALFDNHTWSKHFEGDHFDHEDHSVAWKHPQVNVFGTLTISFIMKFFMSAVAISMPVPCGAFVPAFVIGAGLGRLVGEVAAVVLPEGVHSNGTVYSLIPGSYAVAGAAAMSGAATHTISTAMIVFELTGQINFLFPILFCVIVANIVAQSLQPSLYDSLIRIRKLPYPVELSWDHEEKSDIHVEDIMVNDVKYITLNSTYRDLQNLLLRKLRTIPLVKSEESKILLGSVERVQLQMLLSNQLSRMRRLKYLHQQVQNKDGGHEVRSEARETSVDGASQSFSSKPLIIERGYQDSEVTLKSLFCADSRVDIEEDPDVEDTMTMKEIIEWEEQQLDEKVNFNLCKIDPASVQIVERTSLQKIHNIFSMMGLDHAYVTSVGRLVGVVSRQELRKGFETSVKTAGAKTHPPMSSFRESNTRFRKTQTPEATELHKLLGSQNNLNQTSSL
ncbi:chloride channel protein 2 isoform X2 [Pangasianodon hypophthalmus]|uniref:chloride channel protein 2 isoform X2 n=1 Tax=Pangasianodon hypophthalmus TaxID=310915 RepID=UPI00147BF3C9|nr:chloride channel protein 2 isoform X2 [Pangasianodon hypophthalmus]